MKKQRARAAAAGRGQIERKTTSTSNDDRNKVVSLFPRKETRSSQVVDGQAKVACAVCGKPTDGWGTVTDFSKEGSKKHGRVCSRICHNEFHKQEELVRKWEPVKFVVGPDGNKRPANLASSKGKTSK